MINAQLKKEIQYFQENMHSLVKEYPDKYVVIKDKKVRGAYTTPRAAYIKAQDELKLQPGTFVIRQCTKVSSEKHILCFSEQALCGK